MIQDKPTNLKLLDHSIKCNHFDIENEIFTGYENKSEPLKNTYYRKCAFFSDH